MKRLLLFLLLLIPFEADAVIFVASTATQASGSAFTLNLPANQANDIIIIAIQTSNESITAPTGGYTEIDSQASMATGTAVSSGSLRMGIFWKRSSGSETNPTIADSGDHQITSTIVVRGAVTTGNPWYVETCGVQATTSTAVSWQSSGMVYSGGVSTLTTTVPGTLVLGFIAHGIDIGVAQVTLHACATLNDLTEVADVATATGTGGGIDVFSGIKPAAGAVVDTGSNNATATLAATSAYAMFFIALRSANLNGPLYIGQGASISGTTSIAATIPTNFSTNDIFLLVVESSNEAISAPNANWHEIDAQASMGTGTAVTAGSLRMAVFYKRAGDGADGTVTVADTGDHTIAQIFAFTNCTTTGNPYDVESVGVDATATTAASWGSGTITYGTNGGIVTSTVANTLGFVAIANGTDSNTLQTSNQTASALSNFLAELGDANTASGTGGGFSISIGDMPTAGLIVNGASSPTVQATLLTSTKYAMAVIALKPPVTGITAQQKAAFFQLFP